MGGGAAHCFYHFFAEFHGWREGFWVAAEDEAEIDVEEVARGGEEEVVEVAVAYAEEVGDDAVAGYCFDVLVNSKEIDNNKTTHHNYEYNSP